MLPEQDIKNYLSESSLEDDAWGLNSDWTYKQASV